MDFTLPAQILPYLQYLPYALTVSLIIDWLQTRYIAKNPKIWSEINVYLGVHPSVGRVNVYFLICILAGWFVPWWLQAGVLALETYITIRNYKLGIKIA